MIRLKGLLNSEDADDLKDHKYDDLFVAQIMQRVRGLAVFFVFFPNDHL